MRSRLQLADSICELGSLDRDQCNCELRTIRLSKEQDSLQPFRRPRRPHRATEVSFGGDDRYRGVLAQAIMDSLGFGDIHRNVTPSCSMKVPVPFREPIVGFFENLSENILGSETNVISVRLRANCRGDDAMTSASIVAPRLRA